MLQDSFSSGPVLEVSSERRLQQWNDEHENKHEVTACEIDDMAIIMIPKLTQLLKRTYKNGITT